MVNIRLIQGDCIEVMQTLIDEDVKVDLVLTDLPYGITANEWDNIIPFEEMWACIKQIKKDERTPILFFASQPFTSKLVMSKLDWFRYEWIYQKKNGTNFGVYRYQPMKIHEEILVFGEKSPNYYPIKEPKAESTIQREKYKIPSSKTHTYNGLRTLEHGGDGSSELRNPVSIRKANNLNPSNRGSHPNQKPVELLEYLIKTYTNEYDIVLDFTMGSGSTGVACQNLNRGFIGIELDTEYFKVAKKRVYDVQSKLI